MTNIDYSGRITEYQKSSYRSPTMPYGFNLSTDDIEQEVARTKKELERQLYGLILRLGEDPATYATESHVVPEDETTENYPIKLDIARVLSNLAFIDSL